MAPRTRQSTTPDTTKKPNQLRVVWSASTLKKLVNHAISRRLEWSKNNKMMKEHEKKKFAEEVIGRDDVKAVKSVMCKWNEVRAVCVKANSHVKKMKGEKEKSGSSNLVTIDYEETWCNFVGFPKKLSLDSKSSLYKYCKDTFKYNPTIASSSTTNVDSIEGTIGKRNFNNLVKDSVLENLYHGKRRKPAGRSSDGDGGGTSAKTMKQSILDMEQQKIELLAQIVPEKINKDAEFDNKMAKLKSLLDSKFLTPEEFESKKSRLIDEYLKF